MARAHHRSIRQDLPTGAVTMLFTDVEGSTKLLREIGEAYAEALKEHHRILRSAFTAHHGVELDTQGDAFFVAFARASDAVLAAVDAQRALAGGPIKVRMGLHTGEPQLTEEGYVGLDVHKASRIMSAGHGGQVLLSATTAALVMDQLPDGSALRDLGEHRLKDLGHPERVFQLVYPGLPVSFPPLLTLTLRQSELPTQPSGFVGRAAELEEIQKRLDDQSVRLLTLTGPGGIGKTRLALRAANDATKRFEDGVFFVDLSPVRTSEAVLATIARAIGLGDAPDESLLDELDRRLRELHVLLVLDNFEHVTAAAPTVAQLLRCPRLKLLVTSREALHVRGEHLFAVPPLSLPGVSTRHVSAEQIGPYEAIQLFVERAQAVSPDFELTDDNAAAVAEICLRLDGLPLAIELATARINLFSPNALRDRLSSRLELLRSGARDLPARQQTLRATIEWSYQLLDRSEQRLFELLSVFSGAAFEAVEAVAASIDGGGETGIDALDGLASLVDKSLIRRADPQNGQPRLVMLETIREYAAERLENVPDFAAAVRRAHAIHFSDFASRQWGHLTGPSRETALAAMAADLENLRLAWRYWVAEDDLDQLNRLVDSLWLLYDVRGWYQATIELTTELLNVLSTAPSTRERAMQEVTLRTSLARALMAIHGYTREVEQAYLRAVELLESQQELPHLFPVLRGLASFYNYRAEFEKGEQVGREILRLAEAQDDASMRVDGHLVLGSSLALRADLRGGLEHLDTAIAFFESQGQESRRFRLGNNPGVASLTVSALTLWMLGFPDRALERVHRAVALATELEHPVTLAYALFHSGFLHLWRREHELVRDRGLDVIAVAEDKDLQIWKALGACLLGAGQTGLGRFKEGLTTIREGIALYEGLRTPPVFWPLLLYMRAGACSQSGRAAEGLGMIEEAIDIAHTCAGLTLVPEFYRQKGELLLALPEADGPDAERWFRRAFDASVELGAKMPQLRAAIGLCLAQRERGDAEEGSRLLSAVHATFTEGFATPDLVEAAELLASPTKVGAPARDARG